MSNWVLALIIVGGIILFLIMLWMSAMIHAVHAIADHVCDLRQINEALLDEAKYHERPPDGGRKTKTSADDGPAAPMVARAKRRLDRIRQQTMGGDD